MSKQSEAIKKFHRTKKGFAEYHSLMEAERQTGLDNSAIGRCCRGNHKYKYVGGYKWQYSSDTKETLWHIH